MPPTFRGDCFHVEIRHSGASRPVYVSPSLPRDAADGLAQRKRDEADRRGWSVVVDVVPVERKGGKRTMTDYTVTGRAMTLSVETGRACGHLVGIDGEETPDGRDSYAARCSVERDARILAQKLGKTVEVFASHPSCQDWLVCEVGL